MKSCLILDDSSTIRRVAARLLGAFDIRTREAETVDMALMMCQDELPDCILVDRYLPDFDPLRFIAQLRRMPGGERIRVLCCSFENEPGSYAKMVQNGFAGVLMKPFDKDSMRSSLSGAGII